MNHIRSRPARILELIEAANLRSQEIQWLRAELRDLFIETSEREEREEIEAENA